MRNEGQDEPQVLHTQINNGGHSVDDSILDGITNISREGEEKHQSRQMASTAKASFRNKQAFPAGGGNSTSKVQKSTQDASKIHSLYQDLYLTDLKNDVGELETDLSREKEKNLQLTQMLNKCKKELVNQKRTIANYRKAVTDMQKDFFGAGSAGGPPSSITMTSVGRMSGMKRDISINDDAMGSAEKDKNDDAVSSTSAAVRDREIQQSTNKVQQFLDANHLQPSKKSSSVMRSGPNQHQRAARINYNTACDFERMDKFKQ